MTTITISNSMPADRCQALADPLDRLRRLEINAKEWLAALSLPQLLAVAGALQDTLLERRCPAAPVLSQAVMMIRGQTERMP
jgi:hypothetical protein